MRLIKQERRSQVPILRRLYVLLIISAPLAVTVHVFVWVRRAEILKGCLRRFPFIIAFTKCYNTTTWPHRHCGYANVNHSQYLERKNTNTSVQSLHPKNSRAQVMGDGCWKVNFRVFDCSTQQFLCTVPSSWAELAGSSLNITQLWPSFTEWAWWD